MYTPNQLNEFAEIARYRGKAKFRVDFKSETDSWINYAINLDSYQEAVCMADTLFACNEEGANIDSVRISQG